MYTQRKLNTFHQHNSESINTEQASQLTAPLTDNSNQSHDHKHTHLTKIQKAALVADFITHTGDVSGAITAGVDLITKFATNNAVPQWGRALIQCGATLFGATSAVASVLSCKNAILRQNEPSSSPENHTHLSNVV